MREFGEILEEVRGRIAAACSRAGRDPSEVEIVAVTKTHGAEVVREAWDAGLTIVGENKVQEAAWKKPASVSGPQWHLIGHLQSNKVRHALELFDFIHSVDSAKLADRINLIADEIGASPHILLEVNVSGEKSKSGMRPEDVSEVLRHIASECPRVTVEGLMTMAPFSENPEDARPYFRRLRELRDREYGILLELSHKRRDRKGRVRVVEDQRRLASRGAFTDQVKAFLSLHKSSEQCPVFGFRMEEILVLRPCHSDVLTDLPEDLPAESRASLRYMHLLRSKRPRSYRPRGIPVHPRIPPTG